MTDMTRADRAELRRVVGMRCKVARNGIKARTAELLAEFEAQVAAEYEFDDARWKDVTTAAARAVAEADALVAAACEESGIPADFRPRLTGSTGTTGARAPVPSVERSCVGSPTLGSTPSARQPIPPSTGRNWTRAPT